MNKFRSTFNQTNSNKKQEDEMDIEKFKRLVHDDRLVLREGDITQTQWQVQLN